MIDFNVTVKDQQGNLVTTPLVVRIDAGLSGTVRNTNPANFYNGPALVNPWIGDIEVIAAGYAPWTTGANPQVIFKDSTIEYQVVLTSSFKKPSRDQIVNVKGNFCNLFDSEGIPIFDIFIDWLIVNNPTKATDWINILKAAGTTHINLRLSGDYAENLGWIDRYPIPGMDWTNNLSGFSSIINYVQRRGLIPIIKLALDGQSPVGGGYVNEGMTYGWQWGINNLARIFNSLSPFTDSVLWSTGYDSCFPDWTRDQTIQILTLMRNLLGPTACIDTEFGGPGSVGYCHMGNGAGDWTPSTLGILDNFSIEVMTYPPDTVGVQQTASRLLGPTSKNIDPPNVGPYYLAGLEKKINICLYEDIAYQIIRKQVTSQNAIEAARVCANYGFSSFGNGQI